MKARRIVPWFVGAFALGLVLALPLQLAVAQLPLPPGVSAVAVDGSLWNGRLRRLAWNGASFGEVRAGLSPLSLVTGLRRFRLATDDAGLALVAGRLRGVDGADGVLPLPPQQGLALRAWFDDARLLFDGDACRQAGGQVRIEATLPGDALPPLLLTGTPACEGQAGVLALAPEDPAGPLRLDATVRIEADGHVTLQTSARTDDAGIRAALLAAGFQEAAGGLSRVDAGRIGPLSAGAHGSRLPRKVTGGRDTLRAPECDRIATLP